MPGPRQPVELILSKGKTHIGKDEIEERRKTEVQPCTEEIEAPSYLKTAQKARFDKLARQLQKIKILGETDCETLARYVVSELQYEALTKELRTLMHKAPKEADCEDQREYFELYDLWMLSQERASKAQDRYFRQATASAKELGLTISSRCKLVVPKSEDDAPKVNKFLKFEKAAGSE